MKRPLIGVTCNYDYRDTVGITSGMGIVGQDWNFVAGDYVYILEKAGAIPVLIPVYKDCDEESIKEFLNKLDGVIISGGHDVVSFGSSTILLPKDTAERLSRSAITMISQLQSTL